jgi:energy-coupling factor transport system permease protein
MAMAPQIILGRFIPVDSHVARLDPRAKLAAAVIVLAALLVPRSPLAFLPMLALLAVSIGAARLPARAFFGSARSLGGLVLITLAFQLLFVPAAGRLLARVGPIAITWEGVERGLTFAAALLLTLLFASLFTLTTPPIDVADALRRSLAPLRRWRVPVEDVALVAMIALRFAPTLVDEAERIRKAQVARGLKPGRGIVAAARALLPLLVPLVEGVFRRADHLAAALEARGYEVGAPRSAYRAMRFGAAEVVALLLAAIAAGATVALAVHARGPA